MNFSNLINKHEILKLTLYDARWDVKQMKVVNDDAEWDVALIQEFKVLITRLVQGHGWNFQSCLKDILLVLISK